MKEEKMTMHTQYAPQSQHRRYAANAQTRCRKNLPRLIRPIKRGDLAGIGLMATIALGITISCVSAYHYNKSDAVISVKIPQWLHNAVGTDQSR